MAARWPLRPEGKHRGSQARGRPERSARLDCARLWTPALERPRLGSAALRRARTRGWGSPSPHLPPSLPFPSPPLTRTPKEKLSVAGSQRYSGKIIKLEQVSDLVRYCLGFRRGKIWSVLAVLCKKIGMRADVIAKFPSRLLNRNSAHFRGGIFYILRLSLCP